MEIKLTKESRKVLKSIYDIYCKRRKTGQSKSASVYFDADSSDRIEGFNDAISELSNAKLLKIFITGDFEITDQAIIFMENFTKETISKWLELGSNFIP